MDVKHFSNGDSSVCVTSYVLGDPAQLSTHKMFNTSENA